ncbi:MAG: sulfatase [Opitutales bacterium]
MIVRFLLVACLWLLLGLEAGARPNVVFVIADDLNDWIGPLGGHPQAQTPAFDALAERATNFTNAHSNAPVCAPSRASLLSGLHPLTTGFYGYNQNDGHHWRQPPLLRRSRTLPEHFQAHGYTVWGTGKVTHNSQHLWGLFNYPDDDTSGYGPPHDFGPWPWDGRNKRPHPDNRSPFGDFFMKSIAPLSAVPSFPADPEKGIPGYTGWRMRWNAGQPFHYEGPDDRSLMPDEACADYAVEKLSQEHEQPFLLIVGFNRPHTPLYAPKAFFDLYPEETLLPPPGFLEDDLEDVAPSQRDPSSDWEKMRANYAHGEGFRLQVQGYLACVSFVDAQLGKILDALDAGPHAEDTIVIVTSDHGYHNFEKKHRGKNTGWERSTRVPLLVRLPGQQHAAASGDPVALLDLFPTLNALCELPNDPHAETHGQPLDGRDLSPLLRDPNANLPGSTGVISSIRGISVSDDFSDWPVPAEQLMHSLRTRNYRYIRTHLGEEEFYDLRTDPYEWHNRLEDPAYAPEIERHRAELQRRLEGAVSPK